MSRPTVQDIADAVGVSKMTVSRSLRGIGRVSPQTRDRVRAAARQMGYLVSSDCVLGPPPHRGKSDHCLRLLLPVLSRSRFEVTGRISSEICRGLQERLNLNGGSFESIDCRTLDDIHGAWQDSRANGIVIRWQIPMRWAAALRELGPVVYAVATDVYPDVDAVYTNEFRAAASLQRHLGELGHRAVCWFGIIDHNVSESLPKEMFEEMGEGDRARFSVHGQRYASWMYVAGRGPGAQPVVLIDRDWQRESVYESVRRGLALCLQAEPRPTAIVVPTVAMANCLEEAAAELGLRIPDDLSLVCYNVAEHRLPSGLSCAVIRLPMYDVGRAIPDLIERRLADPDAISLTLMFETAFTPGNSLAELPCQ